MLTILRTKGNLFRWSFIVWILLVQLFGPMATTAEFTRMSTRTVTTKYGALKGYIETPNSKHLQSVEVFLGVPYASPPTGPLRFMPPVTLSPWRGVRMCDRFAPVCPQKFPDIKNESEALKRMPLGRLEYLRRLAPFLTRQSEDCLYLNIYTPAIVGRASARLPVMMFIHGESYEWNSGNPYDGTILSSYGNVVVITINYRLGLLGFLPHMESSARGNNGLLDQTAALHWIQGNIGEFGGDPRNVTIFGHGHGAAMVNLLMLTPMARGLFQRAIMMSGSALSPWAIAKDAISYTHQVAQKLDCPIDDNRALVECLRGVPVSQIQRVSLTVPDHLTAFGPTVDGIVILDDPKKMMEDMNTQFKNYDVMFGVSRLESYFFVSASEEKYGIEVDRRDRILRTLVRNLYNYHQQEIFYTIVNEYTDWTKPFQHPVNILEGTGEAVGDVTVVAPIVQTGNLHSQVSQKTYFYVFAYQTENGDYPSRIGCVHGEELPYIFGAPLVPSLSHFPKNFTRGEQSFAELVMTYWTNFAKYGEPGNPAHDPEMMNDRAKSRYDRFNWPPYEVDHQKYLFIALKPKAKDHYHSHRLSLWLNLIPQLHRPGGPEVGAQHHLLDDHDNLLSYDGNVREGSHLGMTSQPPFPALHTSPTPSEATPLSSSPSSPTVDPESVTPTTPNVSDSMMVLLQYGGYSTALSVTIAVGCSLLILNVLIFAGVYYQRDKTKLEAKLQKRSYKVGKPPEPDPAPASVAPNKQQMALRAPPPSPVGIMSQNVDNRLVQALPIQGVKPLPPRVPPKPSVVPPREKAIPEAQPLLAQGATRVVMQSRPPQVQDGVVANIETCHNYIHTDPLMDKVISKVEQPGIPQQNCSKCWN